MKLIWLATEAHQLHHDIVIPVSDLFPETELHSTDANFRVLVLFYMHIMGFCHTLQTSSQPRSSGLHYFYPLHFHVQGRPGNSTHGLCTHHGSPHIVLCSFCYMAQWAITPYNYVVFCYTIYDVQHSLHPQNIRYCADHLRPHYHWPVLGNVLDNFNSDLFPC